MLKNADRPDALARDMAALDEGERIRRWRRGMQAAEKRQRALRAAEGPRPAQAVAECLSALNALEAMGRWPGPRDPVNEQNVQEVRDRWARIQRRARAQALLEKAVAGAVARFHVDIRRLARAALQQELRRVRKREGALARAEPTTRTPPTTAGTSRRGSLGTPRPRP
jgi:hypothetical protein